MNVYAQGGGSHLPRANKRIAHCSRSSYITTHASTTVYFSVVSEFMVHLWFSCLIHCEILALMLLASNAPASEIPLRVWADDSTPDKDSLSTPTHTHIDTGKQYVTLIIANAIRTVFCLLLFLLFWSCRNDSCMPNAKSCISILFQNSCHFLLTKERVERKLWKAVFTSRVNREK